MNSNFQSTALSICIIDEDQTDASRALTSYLGSLHTIVDIEPEAEALADQLYYRTLNYILTIPSGFEKELLSQHTKYLLTDVKIPGSANGTFVDQQVTQYTNTLQIYLAGGYSLADAIEETDRSISDLQTIEKISFDAEGSVTNNRVFSFYQYLPYIFIVMLFAGLAPILVIQNKKEMRERTLCSSLTTTSRSMQLGLCCVLYSLSVWLVLMLLGAIVYKASFFTSYSLLGILNSFVFLLFSASVTLLLSMFSPNENVINMVSNIVGLSMSFFCGVFVPQAMLSDGVLSVGRFLPAYWYIKNNNMLSGASNEVFTTSSYLHSIGIQLLFTCAAFAITLGFSKAKKQNN